MTIHRKTNVSERHLAEFTNRCCSSRCHNVVVRDFLLQHQPHSLHIITRVAPVALGVEVAKNDLILQTELDARDTMSNFPGDEFNAPQWRFMIEQDTARGV